MECLVSGGAGFIGSNLVSKLIELGNNVVVVDDFSLGKEKNLDKNAVVYKKSICDDLNNIFRENKIDAVFHLAALPRVQFSIEKPIETNYVNVNGTLNLLNYCKNFNVKRFVFSSSSSVYGNQERLPVVETMIPNPLSPYALQKMTGEHYCRLFNSLHGLETVSLRYFNVYGPKQNPDSEYSALIPKFIKLVNKGINPTIYGDGEQTRDFTFVSDVVNANVLAANTNNKKCFGNVFNIGAGRNISVNDVAKRIIELSKKDIKPVYGKAVVEARDSLADNRKPREFFGWIPEVGFEEGLKRTYEYFTN